MGKIHQLQVIPDRANSTVAYARGFAPNPARPVRRAHFILCFDTKNEARKIPKGESLILKTNITTTCAEQK
jgi:hypothetical protein